MNTNKRYTKPEVEIYFLEMEPFMSASSVTGVISPTGILQGEEPTDVTYFSNKTFGREDE